jgi:hypothetical protein
MELLGDLGCVESRFGLFGDSVSVSLVSVCLEIVSVSVQDGCTVCAKRTTGLEIILDAHDGTAR